MARGLAAGSVTFKRGRLDPPGWHVRVSFSPLGAGFGLWALAICEEGIAVLRLPRSRSWSITLRAGLQAGLAHHAEVEGDGWPLGQAAAEVPIDAARLFPRATLAQARVCRAWTFWRKVVLADRTGARMALRFLDPRQAEPCALALRRLGGGAA